MGKLAVDDDGMGREIGRGRSKLRFNRVLRSIPPATVITTITVTRVLPWSSRKPLTARVINVRIPTLPSAV